MLCNITSTGDELLSNVNIDELEWLWTPKIGGFSEFVCNFGLRHTFQEWVALKWLAVDQDNLHMKFSALNVDFSNSSSDSLGLEGGLCSVGVKEGYLSAVGLAWKWLQIGTDMLLHITSTGDEGLRIVNTDERHNDIMTKCKLWGWRTQKPYLGKIWGKI